MHVLFHFIDFNHNDYVGMIFVQAVEAHLKTVLPQSSNVRLMMSCMGSVLK